MKEKELGGETLFPSLSYDALRARMKRSSESSIFDGALKKGNDRGTPRSVSREGKGVGR